MLVVKLFYPVCCHSSKQKVQVRDIMVVECKELTSLQELYPNEDVRILNAFLSLKNHDLKATIDHYDVSAL